MGLRVSIVDHGTGNLRSVWRALNYAGVAADVTSDPKELGDADKIVLPGVGNFRQAMAGLYRRNLIPALDEAVRHRQKPFLGICLGMELLAMGSEEGNVAGLGWLPALAIRFRPTDTQKFKVPFIGWNTVEKKQNGELLSGVNDSAEFYFLHSYHLKLENDDAVKGDTLYETRFPSVVEHENIFGVQFHPERSHEAGDRVLRNFLRL
jgi:glutamine amidotransferase